MYARITQRWEDGQEIEVEVGTEHDAPAFPQEIAELAGRVVALYREALA